MRPALYRAALALTLALAGCASPRVLVPTPPQTFICPPAPVVVPPCVREAKPEIPPPESQLIDRLKWEEDIDIFAGDCLAQAEAWLAQHGRCFAK